MKTCLLIFLTLLMSNSSAYYATCTNDMDKAVVKRMKKKFAGMSDYCQIVTYGQVEGDAYSERQSFTAYVRCHDYSESKYFYVEMARNNAWWRSPCRVTRIEVCSDRNCDNI